jgi:hypothetical protein
MILCRLHDNLLYKHTYTVESGFKCQLSVYIKSWVGESCNFLFSAFKEYLKMKNRYIANKGQKGQESFLEIKQAVT